MVWNKPDKGRPICFGSFKLGTCVLCWDNNKWKKKQGLFLKGEEKYALWKFLYFYVKMDGLQVIRHLIFFSSCSSRGNIFLLGFTLYWKRICVIEETEWNLSGTAQSCLPMIPMVYTVFNKLLPVPDTMLTLVPIFLLYSQLSPLFLYTVNTLTSLSSSTSMTSITKRQNVI